MVTVQDIAASDTPAGCGRLDHTAQHHGQLLLLLLDDASPVY